MEPGDHVDQGKSRVIRARSRGRYFIYISFVTSRRLDRQHDSPFSLLERTFGDYACTDCLGYFLDSENSIGVSVGVSVFCVKAASQIGYVIAFSVLVYHRICSSQLFYITPSALKMKC